MNHPGTSTSWKQLSTQAERQGVGNYAPEPSESYRYGRGATQQEPWPKRKYSREYVVLLFLPPSTLCFSADASCWEKVSCAQPFNPSWPRKNGSWTRNTWSSHNLYFVGLSSRFRLALSFQYFRLQGQCGIKRGRVLVGQFPFVSRLAATSRTRLVHMTGADLTLSLLYMSEHCSAQRLTVVFSFTTLIPRYNGQKCIESFSGIGNQCMVFCSTLPLIGKTQPEAREGKRGLDNVVF